MKHIDSIAIQGRVQRLIWVDIAKLLAILLVLIGHFIQIYDANYRQSESFLFIYSFHMPLFMMLSGLFLDFEKLLKWREILVKRFLHIIMPSLLWLFVIAGVSYLLGSSKPLFQFIWYGLWFLKSLFVCIFILVVTAALLKKSSLSMVFSIIISQLTIFIPHLWFLQINIMLPCIVIGIYLKRLFVSRNCLIYIASASMLTYIVMYNVWGGKFTILPKLYPLLTSNWIPTYILLICKLIIGVSGSLFIISFMKLLFENNTNLIVEKLSVLGRYTMEIYILQSLLLETIIAHFVSIDMGACYNLFVWIIYPFLSFILILICVAICKLIHKARMDWVFNFNKLKKR